MVYFHTYRNELVILRARATAINLKSYVPVQAVLMLLKKQYKKSSRRFILHILKLIKQHIVKQIVYFHTYRYIQKSYRIYTPANALNDW